MRRVEICDEQGAVLETVNIDDSDPAWENEVLSRYNERGTAVLDLETNTVPAEVIQADAKARDTAAGKSKVKGVSVRSVDSSGTYPSATPLAQRPRFDAETQEQLAHALRSNHLRQEDIAKKSFEIAQSHQADLDREASRGAAPKAPVPAKG